jgi:predicted ATPase
MIVGLCGTQGTGKSTILQAAEAAGFKVDCTQVSRTVQANLGWDKLSRAEESVENMMLLQNEIANVMYDRDIKYLDSDEVVLVERTPADVWAYTCVWCKRNNVSISINPWAVDYKHRMQRMSTFYTRFIIVPQVAEIPFVEDPHRADYESRQYVDNIIRDFLKRGGLPYNEMKTISREERSAEIAALLTLIKMEKT